MVSDKQGEKLPAYRWYALFLLTLVYTIQGIDRNLIVIMAEPIRAEFHLSDTQIGLLAGLTFAVAFAAGGIPIGFLIDRVNRARLGAALLAAWSTATLMVAFVRGFPTLLLSRFAVAGTEAGGSPTCMSLISDFFPKSQRGTAMGLFFLSTPLSLAAGFAIPGLAAQHMGWRNVFILAGVPGLMLALVVLSTLREPQRGAFDPPSPPQKSSFRSVTATLRNRMVLFYLAAGMTAAVTGQSAISTFMPSYLIRFHGLHVGDVGLIMGLYMGLGGALGMPLGGVVADRLTKRSPALVPRLFGWTVLAAAPIAMTSFFMGSLYWEIGLLFIYAALTLSYQSGIIATYMTLCPPSVRGAMVAFLLVAQNLVGQGVGPQLAGILSDFLKSLGMVQYLRSALIIMLGFLLIASAMFFMASKASGSDGAEVRPTDVTKLGDIGDAVVA